MHKVILIGNVGKDPEVKTFDNGGKVANFSIADTERAYKTKDGKEIPEHTEWFNCVARGAFVNVVENYVKKGTKVFVCGKVRTREYEKDGVKHEVKEVVINELELLSPKGTTEGVPQAPQPQPKNDEGDLPF